MPGLPRSIPPLVFGLACAIGLVGCQGERSLKAEGQVFDPAGAPIVGASVTLAPTPSSGMTEKPRQTMTDASGKFSELVMLPETYKKREFFLEIAKDGYAPSLQTIEDDSLGLRITLEPEVTAGSKSKVRRDGIVPPPKPTGR